MVKIVLWIVFGLFAVGVVISMTKDKSQDSNTTTTTTKSVKSDYSNKARDLYKEAIKSAEYEQVKALKLLNSSCSEGYEEACSLLKYVQHIQNR